MFVDGPELFSVLAQLDIEENILTDFQKHPPSGLGGDAITSLSVGKFTKSVPGTKRPNLSTDRHVFKLAQLDIVANIVAKFHSNPFIGFGRGDAITRKSKMADGGHVCRRTGIFYGTCTTRNWREQTNFRKIKQWSFMRSITRTCLSEVSLSVLMYLSLEFKELLKWLDLWTGQT